MSTKPGQVHTLDLNPGLLLIIFILLGIAVGIVVHFAFVPVGKWLSSHKYLREHSETANHFIGVVGVIYAVLVAFVVVTAWQARDHAEEISIQERHNVDDLFHLDDAYRDPKDTAYLDRNAESVRRMLRAYTTKMQIEWYQMQENVPLCLDTATTGPACEFNGKITVSKRANDLAHCIRERTFALPPTKTQAQVIYRQVIYQEGIRLAQNFSENRAERRHHYMEATLQPILWESFFWGALILVGMTYFVGGQDQRSHLSRTAALFAMIGLLVALAFVFDHPFVGSMHINDVDKWNALQVHFDADLNSDKVLKGTALPAMCSD